MTDPYVEDLEFCNKANIAAARRFKAERDELAKTLEVQRPSVMEVENYRLALAWISEQSMDLKSRELANTALIHTGEGIGPTPNLKAENARLRKALEDIRDATLAGRFWKEGLETARTWYHEEWDGSSIQLDLARDIAEVIEREVNKADEQTVPVPRAALDWLFGASPDADGKWFGDCEDEGSGNFRHKFWWRSKFRSMVPALTVGDRGGVT